MQNNQLNIRADRLDYAQIVFQQIDRVSQAAHSINTDKNQRLSRQELFLDVLTLEGTLSPELDEEYWEEKKKIGHLDLASFDANPTLIIKWYSLLMQYLPNTGLVPKKQRPLRSNE